jgi:fructoselysine-6-P-deglycase FrlB-like protein
VTQFLKDILRQPKELERSLAFLTGDGTELLERAVSLARSASQVVLTGIGSSWHAAMSAGTVFQRSGKPVQLIDAAELLHFAEIPQGAAVIMLSRTGRSVEIVRLIEKVHASGGKVIGVTNARDGALAQDSDVALLLEVAFDHAISVNTYSTLALAAGVLAAQVVGRFEGHTARELQNGICATAERMDSWRDQVDATDWLEPAAAYYFLARGASLGSCHEARLLWEEGVKQPATAMGTGGFRHGPQEIVTRGMHFGIWIDAQRMREEDLAVARDLTHMGARVALIGQGVSDVSAEAAFEIPKIPAEWQYVVDPIPAQLLAERLSRLAGVDCDSFRYCSFIVEDEGGLLETKS